MELFPMLFGMKLIPFLLFYVLLSLISSFSSVLTAYAAISLGQLFAKHKVMASILCYIGFTMLIQIVTSILMIPLPDPADPVRGHAGGHRHHPRSLRRNMREVFFISMAGSLICAVVSYILSGYIMKKTAEPGLTGIKSTMPGAPFRIRPGHGSRTFFPRDAFPRSDFPRNAFSRGSIS